MSTDNQPFPPLTDQQCANLLGFLNRQDRISKLSDCELSEEVLNKVWGKLILGSEEDSLLDEMITRFELVMGIERNEEGELIDESAPTEEELIRIEDVKARFGKAVQRAQDKNGTLDVD